LSNRKSSNRKLSYGFSRDKNYQLSTINCQLSTIVRPIVRGLPR